MADNDTSVVICNLTEEPEDSCGAKPRVPVLACRDALAGAGAAVELVSLRSDAEIDALLATFRRPGPAGRPGLADRQPGPPVDHRGQLGQ